MSSKKRLSNVFVPRSMSDDEAAERPSKSGSKTAKKPVNGKENIDDEEEDGALPNEDVDEENVMASLAAMNLGASGSGNVKVQLSNPQLSDLYSQCIKLATANKITQKNTWSLRLIDYMDDVLKNDKESLNFQRASCTLDASVMIYSSRVDSVHKDTFKVLGGLSRSDASPADDDDDAGPDENGAADEDGIVKKKKAPARRAGMSTLETKLTALNVKQVEREFEVDPLFHQMSAAFGEGGARGLLLNNVRVYNGCVLAFDGDGIEEYRGAVPIVSEEEKAALAARTAQAQQVAESCASVELGDLRALLDHTAGRTPRSSLKLCPELDSFLSVADELTAKLGHGALLPAGGKGGKGSDDDSDASDAGRKADANRKSTINAFIDPESLAQAIQAEEAMYDHDDGDMGDDDFGGNDSFASAQLQGPPGVSAAAATWSSNLAIASSPSKVRRSDAVAASIGLGFALDEDTRLDSELHLARGLAWAGASHWKFKKPPPAYAGTAAAKRNDDEIADDSAPPVAKGKGSRKAKVFYIDFNAAEVPEKAFAKAPRSTETITQATLDKAAQNASKLVLPVDMHVKAQTLQTLFLRPNVHVKLRRLRPKAASGEAERGGDLLDSSLVHEPAEGGAHGDQLLFDASGGAGSQHQQADLDCSGGGGGGDWDDDDDEPAGFDLVGSLAAMGVADSAQPADVDGPLQLVSAPTRVAAVDIGFARFAKKVDVRQLKDSIWKNITGGVPASGAPAPKSFQSAVTELQSRLPASALLSLSVSYCFICLLHLCNEKNLQLLPGSGGAGGGALSLADFGIQLRADSLSDEKFSGSIQFEKGFTSRA